MEDEQIIELYFERSERAIAETDIKYGSFCRTISRRIVASVDDAEECVNDCYLRTWNAIPPQRPQSLRAFLGRIVRNLSLDRYRKNTAAKRTAQSVPFEELCECIPSGGESVAQQIERNELQTLINEFLQGLSQEQRVYFLRRYWLGEPLAEIAKRYGVSANSLGVTMHRLRERLKKKILESGFYI